MDQQKMTREMNEFKIAVERLWDTYDRVQNKYYKDKDTDTGRFDLKRWYYKAK